MLPQESRPWRQIARELALETNTKRILELSEELDQAFEKQKVNDGKCEGDQASK